MRFTVGASGGRARARWATAAAAAVLLAGVVLPGVPATAGPTSVTLFSSTTPGYKAGATTVPDDICAVEVTVAGGAGGAGISSAGSVAGGVGAALSATVIVTPGEVLDVEVGGVGGDQTVGIPYENGASYGGVGGAGGGGGGGVEGDGNFVADYAGGGGGGASVVSSGGVPLVVAGGGGGGGYTPDGVGGHGGLLAANGGNGGNGAYTGDYTVGSIAGGQGGSPTGVIAATEYDVGGESSPPRTV